MKIEILRKEACKNVYIFFELALISWIVTYLLILIPIEKVPAIVNLVLALLIFPLRFMTFFCAVGFVLNILLYVFLFIIAKFKKSSKK